MAQHDYSIANQTFPNTRTDINNALAAIVSANSGATAPSTTYAYQLWYDTTTDILKMRNADDDAWIGLFTLDQTADTATPVTGASTGETSITLYEYTATAGQTTFSGADDNAATLAYTADNIIVTLNGITLDPSDYTASNGTSVVLVSGASANDVFNVLAFGSFSVADTVSASSGGEFSAPIGLSGVPIYENAQNISTNYTISNARNAMSAGPITIDSGVTVTVGTDETWTVV